jgi:hypothetical protein
VNKIKDEPVMVGSIVAAVMSLLAMGVALGWWGLDGEQLSAIREFLVALLPLLLPIVVLIGGWWGRQRAVSVEKLKRNNINPSRLV